MQHDELNKQIEYYFNKYSDKILRYCYSKLKDNANNVDDCVQEAFSALYKKLESGEEIKNVAAFLYQTAYHHVLKQHEEYKKTLNTVYLDDESVDVPYEETFEGNTSESEILQLKDEILNNLPEKDREIFEKLYCEPKEKRVSEKQLAEEYGCSYGAMRQRISVLTKRIKHEARKKAAKTY